MGHLQRQRGEAEQALAAYDRAIALQPGRYEALLAKVRVLEQAGRLQEAEAALAQAVAPALQALRQALGPMPGALTMRAQMAGRLSNADAALALYRALFAPWGRVCVREPVT